jgi:hypothetical protein
MISMNFATYFPEQRHALALTTIRRERMLPQDAIGELEAREGERIDLRDVVARGSVPSRYVFIEALDFFGFRTPAQLDAVRLVEVGDMVDEGQIIAGKASGRGRKLLSPVTGVIAYVGEGRIIIQETPEPVELQAGLIGQVVSVRGVIIETTGAVLQGIWGNGRLVIGTLRMEPEEGVENIFSDQIDMQFRSAIVVTRRPIKAVTLRVVSEQGFSGIIAPSMDVSLIDTATSMRAAILLTQGFSGTRMSQFTFSFLEALAGRQATLDATLPDRFEARRPEVIVNMPIKPGQRPRPPDVDLTLQTGLAVRLTHGERVGQVGTLVHLPKTPYLLENGLRLPCAQVQLVTGESVFVPVANIEVFGQ